MMFLKQSTSVTLKIGPFLDDSDGKTAETALTIAQADVRLSKNGGNIAQKNESTSCTHDELGIYGCPLDATDTNTLGILQLWVHESGALPVWHEYMVVPANVYDSLFSTDRLQVDVREKGDSTLALTTQEKADVDAEVDEALNTAIPGSPTANSINERVATIDDKLPSKSYLRGSADSDGGMDSEDKADVNAEVDTALNTAIPGSPTANSVNERVKAIDDKLPSKNYLRGSADSDGGMDSEDKADINAEVDTALNTAIPGSPTSNSVNERIKTLDDQLPTAQGIKINQAFTDYILLKDSDGDPVTGATVTCTLYDESDNTSNPSVTEVAGGLYKASFTPDAAGTWKVVFDCTNPNVTEAHEFLVGWN